MCGIVGIIDLKEPSAIDRAVLDAMNETQFHRGPDGGGLFIDPGVGLGHRRLSIIDLAAGAQPLFNEDQSVVVVFNGEIYNFQELAAELQAKGHVFRTRCDTEVIVNGWREWGEGCVDHFRGMFAFAVFDRRDQTLFLARDRLGIKPLYYAEVDGRLVFGSELKAIMAYPGVGRALDPLAIDDYFTLGYVPEPRSIYASVSKLRPGHTITVARGAGAITPRQYWDLDFTKRLNGSEEALAEELIDRLAEAVKIRMIADDPLGAFLSGGVDSSAVVAMAARISDQPVNTCSIGFDVGDYDETAYAARVAERYHTRHDVETVATDDFDLIDRLSGMFDEPFADSSAIPTYRVCELARRRVTVALSGDGGDELFAGYRRYQWQMTEHMLRRRFGASGSRALGHMAGLVGGLTGGRVAAAAQTFLAAGGDPVTSYLRSFGGLDRAGRQRLFSRSLQSSLQGYDAGETMASIFRDAPAEDHLSRLQYLDYKTYLPGDILTKVDRTSMAVALEARVPVIDHKFVEWAAGIAPSLRLRGREGKYIFKKALEPHLPRDILYRPKKGFAVPLGAWFRGPLKARLEADLMNGTLMDSGLFEGGEVTRLVGQHWAGRADNSAVIWALLMFDAFLRQSQGSAASARNVA
jgi:asparagine synthase (glutamine-hydrolysing)